MVPLLVGGLLAALALAFVLMPLAQGTQSVASQPGPDVAPESSALEAMREIEFDKATGKLSPEDYEALRARYAPQAMEELRARDSGASASGIAATADVAELLIARARASQSEGCPVHGPRPESDALFCSDCGRSLAA